MSKNSSLVDRLKQQIDRFEPKPESGSQGEIVALGDGTATISGLPETMLAEILEFPMGIKGIALNLNTDTIGAIVLGSDSQLKQGDAVRRTGQLLSIGVSEKIVGRVVSPLGEALDGDNDYEVDEYMPLEKVAPGVITRTPVDTPLQTGVKAIDSMIPIGRGQRELIIGDRSTGKTAVALSTIINQVDNDVICIYVAVGQKRSSVAQTIGILEEHKAMGRTIIVSASASDPAAIQYLAPYAGTAIAEYFADRGKDTLVIYDDLTKHAWAYREVSLLLRRPSGREAYPGDVFYLHSRLLERSVNLNKDHGGGSITALPIIETQAGDVSAYIPTNVISITDGQIFLDNDMFNAGQRPAVNLGISVSRVGGAAQVKAMKQVIGTMKIDMAQYRDLAAFAQFSSDLDPKTRAQIEKGQRITEILKQGWDEPLPVEQQVVIFWAVSNGHVDEVKIDQVRSWEKQLLDHLTSRHQAILDEIIKAGKIDDKLSRKLEKAVVSFNQSHPELMVESVNQDQD